MKTFTGATSQTNIVLYTIIGIFLIGIIFFGVGFKVGNRPEGFSNIETINVRKKKRTLRR